MPDAPSTAKVFIKTYAPDNALGKRNPEELFDKMVKDTYAPGYGVAPITEENTPDRDERAKKLVEAQKAAASEIGKISVKNAHLTRGECLDLSESAKTLADFNLRADQILLAVEEASDPLLFARPDKIPDNLKVIVSWGGAIFPDLDLQAERFDIETIKLHTQDAVDKAVGDHCAKIGMPITPEAKDPNARGK